MKYKMISVFVIALCVIMVLTEAVLKPTFFVKTSDIETLQADLQDSYSSVFPNLSGYIPLSGTAQNTKVIPSDYEKQISDETNELYFSEKNGGVALLNKKTEDIWFSNPLTDTQNSDISSQFKVYYSDESGVSKSMDSFSYCVSRGDIAYKTQKNTLSVEYLLSEDSISVNDVPNIISAERFNKFSEKLEASEKSFLVSNYIFLSIKESNDKEYNKEIINDYPTVEDYDIYVLNTSNRRLLQKILDLFNKAGYTSEDLQKDFKDNGLDFTAQSVSITVVLDYTLKNGSLYLEIDTAKLKYPNKIPIERIELMRFFGSADKNDSGYFLLPDGSGSLLYFNNGKTGESEFSLPIYGNDGCFTVDEQRNITSKCSFPVFGIKKNNSALIVSMEQGEALADIRAEVSGMKGEYNTAYFMLNIVRSQQETVTIKSTNVLKEKKPYSGSFRLRYTPISDSNADYITMAQIYRNQLIELGFIENKKKETKYPILLSLLGSVTREKSFLGIKYNSAVALTSFEEAGLIADDLTALGVKGVNLQYYGWTDGSFRQSSPDKISFNKVLGSEKDLKLLKENIDKKGIDLYFNTSFSNIAVGKGFSIKNDSVKKLSGSSARVYTYNYVNGYKKTNIEPFYILSPAVLSSKVNGFIKRADMLGVSNISSDDLGSTVSSDFNSKRNVDKVEAQAFSREALKSLSEDGGLALSDPNSYAVGYADLAYDVPISDSNFKLTDGSVPFYQAVIRGYVNYTTTPINYSSNSRFAFLRAVEYGAGLNYCLNYHSPNELKNTEYNIYNRGTYSDWSDTIVSDAKSAYDVFSKLEGKEIVGHSRISDGVYKTEYEGGAYVLVNYSDTDYTYKNLTVSAESFALNGGDIS